MSRRPYTTIERLRMSKMWAENFSVAEIADHFGRTRYGTAVFICRNRDWFPKRKGGRRARIDAALAIQLIESGHTRLQVAERFGVKLNSLNVALRLYKRASCVSFADGGAA